MKGTELPFNFIIAIVLVIVAATAYIVFMRQATSPEMTDAEAVNAGCPLLQSNYNCDPDKVESITISGYHPENQPKEGNLYDACKRTVHGISKKDCAELCGCTSNIRGGETIDEGAGVLGPTGVV